MPCPANCSCETCSSLRLNGSPSKRVGDTISSVSSHGFAGSFANGFGVAASKKVRYTSQPLHKATKMKGWSKHITTKFNALSPQNQRFFASCFERSLMVVLVKGDLARVQSIRHKRAEELKQFRASTRSKVNSLDAQIQLLLSAHQSMCLNIGSQEDVHEKSAGLNTGLSDVKVCLNVEDVATERHKIVEKEIGRINTRLAQVKQHKLLAFEQTNVSQPVELQRLCNLDYKVHQSVASDVFEKLLSTHPKMFQPSVSISAPANLTAASSHNSPSIPGQVSTASMTSSVSTTSTCPGTSSSKSGSNTNCYDEEYMDEQAFLDCAESIDEAALAAQDPNAPN